MRALKVRVVAPTASFRYPHFVVGRQPSYPAPPPATVRGLLACALGQLSCPPDYEVAIRFGAAGRADDLEHLHVLSPSGGKLAGSSFAKVVEGRVQPVRREFLFDCWLEVLVRGDDLDRLAAALLRPAFPLVLGRSQDLATVTAVDEIELEEADGCYVEDALAPGPFRESLARGLGLVVAVEVGPPPWREARFARVVWVERRALLDATVPIEVESPVRDGRKRGALFFASR